MPRIHDSIQKGSHLSFLLLVLLFIDRVVYRTQHTFSFYSPARLVIPVCPPALSWQKGSTLHVTVVCFVYLRHLSHPL